MKETHVFAEVIEESAKEQFDSAMDQPFAVKGALMADAHTGYSLPIGGVIATDGVIVPAWIGFDIGCGVCAIPTTFKKADIIARSNEIFEAIYKVVPVGFHHNAKDSVWTDFWKLPQTPVIGNLMQKNGLKQLGSLGGGNHFIEVGYDEREVIWVIVHSGSRNLGHQVATHYMKLASGDGKAREGHYGFSVTSEEGRAYIYDMNYCLAFALENRKQILQKVLGAIQTVCVGTCFAKELINRNHNHAEEKDGLWVHRKGATHAEKGMMGVIPGNMRDGSFIVEGKGNPDSLWSSSHGAGRVMGRKDAERRLNLETFSTQMEGITANVCQDTLDESPDAYKDIFEVMRQQSDLVDIKHHIRPLINIKG